MKEFKLIEHNLIPLTLFMLNISVVHVIYLIYISQLYSGHAILITASTVVMTVGVVRKSKWMMIPASLIYLIALVLSF